MCPRIGRVDDILGVLAHAIFADERVQQAMGMMHVVEAKAALDAQAVLIRWAIAAAHIEQLTLLDVIGELASHAAIGAHAVHLTVGELGAHVRLINEARRHQRAGWTGLHAFAAGDAGRGSHWVVEVEHDLLGVAAPGHADHALDLHLAAGADAEIASDAGVEIDSHRGVAAVGHRTRAARKPAPRDLLALRGLPEFRSRVVRDVLGRLVRHQQLEHHAARGLGAIGLRLHLHARRRRAEATCGEHPLALDLDHADAAIAVRPVAGLGRIAEMRQLDVEAARGAEDRLAVADVDFAIVDGECRRFCETVGAHDHCLIGCAKSSRKYFITEASGLGAAWPSPQIDASRIVAESSLSNASSQAPFAISFTAFSVPTRHGVHWPQLSSSKKRIRLSATAFISSLSDRTTTACDPTKQPYCSSVPKSSGRSAIDAGRMPPEAPPGR